ncbi:uncharacterized protein LOC124271787 [Haliotis rubra]|uniref:uncharacterized protein LOC124271787 n=1 Tax=Haliotis rubra TaxID=36100 RepID=UPI001EE602A2|nr:uncharacterized protein LOC124271787 [Haliotis rubra]
MADPITSATKCRIFLAGVIVGASSSAVVYMLCRKTRANHTYTQTTNTLCESDDEASSPATKFADEIPEEDASCSNATRSALTQVQAMLEGKGVTLILSSALRKVIFLAQGAKTAGLNIVRSEGFDEADDNATHVFGKSSSFIYGKSTFRSERDVVTGKTFILQKFPSEIAVTHPRPGTVAAQSSGSETRVPPLSEIFPFSVLSKMGIRQDPYFGEEEEELQTCSSATVSKTSSGKCVRVIRSRHHQTPTSSARCVQKVEQTGHPDICKVWRLGAEFHDLYHSRYDTYHGIVHPNTPVVLYPGVRK